MGECGKLWNLNQFLFVDDPILVVDTENELNHLMTSLLGCMEEGTKDMISKRSVNIGRLNANEAGGFRESFWLLITPPPRREELIYQAKNFNMFIDSNFILAEYHQCQAKIQSLYRVGSKSDIITEQLGTWNVTSSYRPNTSPNKYERRSDFFGYPLHGTGVDVFEFFTTYLSNYGISGYVGDIITALQVSHNFSLTYEKLPGYAYGSLVEESTNQWNGMVGELQNRRADLTVSELSITKERNEVITYTQPIYLISRKLFVATSEDIWKKLLAYFNPMEGVLYVAIFATMLVLMVSLVYIEKLRHWFLRRHLAENPTTLNEASWFMVSALLQQGCQCGYSLFKFLNSETKRDPLEQSPFL
ncbi:hypothetical protein SK128_009779 [Halocaridina rubra]|uniref:Ionotropic glutamate receptor L-glutamate and glycine-binding domain-containing protein n=1 Tax=Halocaridina rubra TaxID=373956 RepID=A0AAN8WUK1_HALRR